MIQVQLIAIYFAMLVFCKWCWLASPASVPIGGVETSSGIACPQDAGRSDCHSLKLQKHMETLGFLKWHVPAAEGGLQGLLVVASVNTSQKKSLQKRQPQFGWQCNTCWRIEGCYSD